MKLKPRDYVQALFSIFIKEPVDRIVKEVRYQTELGGEGGFEVNGIGSYWGRYASIKKIVELAYSMKNDEDWFTFYFPAEEYDFKYSHDIAIYWIEKKGFILFEYTEASNQCGAYEREVALSELENEIKSLSKITKNPEDFGYIYVES